MTVYINVGQGQGHEDRLTSRAVISSRVDYCDTETFRASCSSQDEVIMIDRAAYGRMRLGRCVETDMGHVGSDGSRGLTWVTWTVMGHVDGLGSRGSLMGHVGSRGSRGFT